MISGEYRHTIDIKNRTFLPAKLREKLGENIVVSRGVDKCLTVYPIESWQKFEESLESLPSIKSRQVRRWMYAFSQEMTVDSQGRIAFPQHLKEYAEFEKNIVSIGVGDHIEIWSEAEYNNMLETMSAKDIEETLIEMGM